VALVLQHLAEIRHVDPAAAGRAARVVLALMLELTADALADDLTADDALFFSATSPTQ
jgi:hypothetical protein